VNAFELTSQVIERSACQGNTILFTANVFGSGNFNVNIDGSASSWGVAVPQSFTLNNNARTVYLYATPNSNVNPGTYSLNLIVSNNQETKTVPFTINVNNCHNIQLTGEASKSICSKDVTQFNYQITNLADYQETLQIDLNGPNFLSASQSLITLNPQESKDIKVYVDENNRVGDYDFTLSASNQYLISEINSNLKVNSCYEFTVTSEKDFVEMCENSQQSIQIVVENIGTREMDYSLSLESPEWINLDSNSFNLEPNQKKTINLVISPPYSTEGDFKINLNINEFKRELNVQVNQCHGVFIDIQEKAISLCNNIQTPVYIKNTGLFEKEFNLQTSEDWARLSNYNIKLQPNEEANVNLIIDPQNLEVKSYDVYVRALALDSSALSSEDKIKVNILNNLQCHDTSISAKDLSVNQDSSATLPITITNNGNEKLIYQISLTGTAASFSQLNPSIIEVNPRSSETVYLYSAPSVEVNSGDYSANIDVSFNNNLLASKVINIKVNEITLKKPGQINLWDKISGFFVGLWSRISIPKTPKIEETPEIEKEPEVIKEPELIEETNKTSFVNDIYQKAKNYWIYILVAIIVIIIALFALFSKSKENDEAENFEEDFDDLKEEEKEDEEEPLKLGRWIVGILIIIGLIWTQWKFNWFNYVKIYALFAWNYANVYKIYLLIALIIILIIVLIVKYWKAIVEFFEEDEEKPKKKIKRKKKK
jgi:uncharacterized membrane protein/flagellar basal body-associated protein FliL